MSQGSNDSAGQQEAGYEFASIMLQVTLVLVLASIVSGLIPSSVQNILPVPMLVFLAMLVLSVIILAAAPASLEATLFSMHPNSEILQAIFFPPLVFSDALNVDLKRFEDARWQILWLVVPALLVGTAITAVFPWLLSITHNFTLFESLTFAAMASNTDPIAVIMGLGAIGAPERLNAIMAGEALMNDAVSIILVELFLRLQAGVNMPAGTIIGFVFQQSLLGPLIGAALAVLALLLIMYFPDDTIAVWTLSLAFPYLAFVVCVFYVKTSGLLAVVTMGLVINRFEKMLLERHMRFIRGIWETIDFVAENLLYALSGALVGWIFMRGKISGLDWLNLLLVYLWLSFARFVVVFASLPLLARIGLGMNWREAVIMWHGALRGAVGLLLSFYIRDSEGVSEKTGELTIFFMAGILALYLINSATVGPLCRFLGLSFNKNDPVFLRARYCISERTMSTLQQMGKDDNLDMDESANPPPPPKYASGRIDPIFATNMSSKRQAVLRACAGIYDSLLAAGLINRHAWLILTEALENKSGADDHVSELFTWQDVLDVSLVRFELKLATCLRCKSCRELLEMDEQSQSQYVVSPNAIPVHSNKHCCAHRKPVLVETLAFAAWGMIVAHKRARRSLRDIFEFEDESFLQDNKVPLEFEALIEESERCCLAPARFIDRVFAFHPEIIARMKALQGRQEIHDGNVEILKILRSRGILTEVQETQLKQEIQLIDKKLANVRFTVSEVDDHHVGTGGTHLLENPNFAPFVDDDQDEDETPPLMRPILLRRCRREFGNDTDQSFEKILKTDTSEKDSVVPLRTTTEGATNHHGDVHALESQNQLVMKTSVMKPIHRLLDQVEVLGDRQVMQED